MNSSESAHENNAPSAEEPPRSMARWDVTTWTMHPAPPSTVDGAADTRARWYFAFSEVSGWAMLPFLLFFVLPSINGVPTLHPLLLIVVTVGTLGAAIIAIIRFRALRMNTGAPVVSDLHEVLDLTGQIFANQQAAFRELAESEDFDAATQAELRKDERRWRRSMRRLRRHLLRHCELAAQAERYGWHRMRDRQVRKIVEMCLIVSRNESDASSTGK